MSALPGLAVLLSLQAWAGIAPPLPEPVTNNAVALVRSAGGPVIYSMQGLAQGKSWREIHARAWQWKIGSTQWEPLPELPLDEGRLAGVAAGIGETAWLFGGYTVAADGSEVSTPEVFRLDGRGVKQVSTMPVPVDDMTAFVYRDRYIYLVSGWHDLGNVNLVQVLDTESMQWSQGTPYPGAAVFGHAGGISGNNMLVCGGVRIEYPEEGGPRKFLPSAQCWLGIIDQQDFRRISWRPVNHHPGPARYRAAATADDSGNIVFAGGTDNPYNFDGIGYDGRASEPLSAVLKYSLETGQWEEPVRLNQPSMDHRGLVYHDGWFYLVGGMLVGQRVTANVTRFSLD